MALLKILDDRKRELTFGRAPTRVVSLVPSDTYTVARLGCASALVGRTDYCERPADEPWLSNWSNVPSIGGTKNPRLDEIKALEPDLILANQEENTRSDLEDLVQSGFRVYVAFPKRVADGLSHLARLARIFHLRGDPAVTAMMQQGYDALNEAEAAAKLAPPLRTFCPIWMDPLMTVHGETFISDMLAVAGAGNIFADRERKYPLAADLGVAVPKPTPAGKDVRYPRVSMAEVNERAPELILLPDEPHPFSEEDAQVFADQPTPAAKHKAIVRTSGKDLCWYGARSVEGIERVRALVDAQRKRYRA
jgi:ABC-type Fe3+-hydroxamate transport system substrate-binding protein